MTTLAEWINAEIKRRHTTMTNFSEQHGLSHSTVSRAMNNKTSPDIATLAKIADAFNADVTALIALVIPDKMSFDADAYALGQVLKSLTPEDRMAVNGLIDRLLEQGKDK